MLTNKKRVVITGLSGICGLGHNKSDIWKNALSGTSCIKKLDDRFVDDINFDYPINIASYVDNFKIDDEILSPKEQDRFDTFIHYALHSAHHALIDSNLKIGEDVLPHKVGCILGVGMGGFPLTESTYRKFLQQSRARTSPFFIPSIIPNMASGLVSIKLGLQGSNFSISSACASSGHAIEMGVRQIQTGIQDAVLVGGAEAVLTKLTIAGFNSMKALSKRDVPAQKASCPFSADRDGFVIGEGAAILVIESLDSARKRKANILAEIVGCGSSADAHHITSPHPEGKGAILAMKQALEESQISFNSVDYINAHGTSTPLGDISETNAIKSVFKDHAYKLNVSSTKSMTGHLLGSAAALESFFCVQSLVHQEIAPTINLEQADPECDLNYTANVSVKKEINFALNNSFGFGGTNSSIIFKRFQGD